MNYKKINERFQEIDSDISVDVLLADLADSNVSLSKLLIKKSGSFRRNYSYDFAGIKHTSILSQELNEVEINRDGIYDTLPEGYFHPFNKSDSNYTSSKDMIGNYHRQLAEEKDARSFFQPLEHELVLFSANHNRKIQKWLFQIENEFFDVIWELDERIPFNFLVKLFSIVPYSHSLVGKTDIVADFLSKILDVDVAIRPTTTDEELSFAGGSSDWVLGISSLVGDLLKVQKNVWEVEIGPIEEEELEKYLAEGALKKFINYYFEYFMPLGTEVEVVLLPVSGMPRNVLGKSTSSVLGEILEI